MIDPKFHKQEVKERFVSPKGFLGAGSDNYRTALGYQHGEDPYRMMKLNPDFVRGIQYNSKYKYEMQLLHHKALYRPMKA